ncbi:CRAL/TRIO domain protein [Teladorsagia circumcincta]|uniref:CRAL/TRIO domain protein n=1 Tax=Teladorsagia circumcincta TaxID=45464 RepID=A0A2G9UHT9_TELCI|nr:CRAL/TRIO domain protein [Teladorsagia circumcincta]
MSNAAEYFPGGLMCQDDEGNVVYMQALAMTHPKTLIKSGAASDLYRLSIIEAELAFKLVRKAEAATGKKLGAKIIIDLDNFSMDVLYPPALNVYLNLLTLLQVILNKYENQFQALFPDFGRHIYVINSPMMIKTVYAMIQPVLSKQTKEKLGEHNIYRHWGGSKASDLPTGDVRMGGKVPEKLQYKAEDNVDDDKKDFTKVTVAARSKVEVKVKGERGKTFRWFWRVSTGDVDFGISRNGEMGKQHHKNHSHAHACSAPRECKHELLWSDETFIHE